MDVVAVVLDALGPELALLGLHARRHLAASAHCQPPAPFPFPFHTPKEDGGKELELKGGNWRWALWKPALLPLPWLPLPGPRRGLKAVPPPPPPPLFPSLVCRPIRYSPVPGCAPCQRTAVHPGRTRGQAHLWLGLCEERLRSHHLPFFFRYHLIQIKHGLGTGASATSPSSDQVTGTEGRRGQGQNDERRVESQRGRAMGRTGAAL